MYLLRGADAESWQTKEIPLSSEVQKGTTHLDADSILADLEKDPAFKAECKKLEAELREKSAEMERAFESELKGKV